MTLTYADQGPALFYDAATHAYIGGRYRDGHAPTAQAQAKMPFLNPLEMNNPSVHSVLNAVRKSPAGDLIEQIYGQHIWKDQDMAFDAIARCLAEFQTLRTPNAFSSRCDPWRSCKR